MISLSSFFSMRQNRRTKRVVFVSGTLVPRTGWSVLKTGFRISPRTNDLALTLTWTSPLDRRLADILFFRPVGFSFLSSLSLQVVQFRQQCALIVELMHMSRCEIEQRLMRSGLIVGLDVTTQFFPGRYLIRIIAHQIDLFLFDRPIKPLGQRIVSGPANPGKG